MKIPFDCDYGPFRNAPGDPRSDEEPPMICPACDGQGCARCQWAGVIETKEEEE